jgi:hypothetical protein
VIVGYSFAVADDYIAKMLVKAVGQNPSKNVIVVDIDDKSIDRGKSYIKLHVDAFDEKKTFFPLRGDGSELVPKLIASLKGTKRSKESKKKAS